MAEKKIVLDIEINTDKANTSVKDTIDSMGKLRRELAQLTLEAEKKDIGAERLAELNAKIKETEKSIKKAESAFGDATDKIRTLSGSGVEKATASFGLLKEGITNLDFGKFKTGVQGVAGSFGALGNAIKATGIGLLVTGITYLIANFDELKKSGGLLGTVLTFIGDKIKLLTDGIEYLADYFEIIDLEEQKRDKKREERSKKFVEDEQKKKGAVEERYNNEIALAKSLGKNTDELEIKSLKAQKAVIDNQIERIKAFQQTTSLFDSVLKPLLEKLTKDQEAAAIKVKVKENEVNTQRNENAKKKNEEKLANEAQHQKDLAELYFTARDEFNAQVEAGQAEEAAKKQAQYQKDLDDLYNQTEAEFGIQVANSEKEIELQKKILEGEKKLQELKVQAVSAGLSLIGDLVNNFAGKNEKAQKRAFNIQKGLSIATTTIDTYLAAQKAYTSQLVPGDPTSPIRGGIAAGIAIAGGLARVAKIAATKFEGGSAPQQTSTPAPNLNSSPAGGGSQTVEAVRPSNFSLFGTGTNANNFGGANGPQMLQAYVVESDISNVQRRVERFRTASEL
jgi:hypothetical protein